MLGFRRLLFVDMLVLVMGVFSAGAYADEQTLTNQTITDVYVDNLGNLAFGIKIYGVMASVGSEKGVLGYVVDPNNQSGTFESSYLDALKHLCVWNQGNNQINDLRFQFMGADKNKALKLLLSARMNNTPVTIIYSPLVPACTDPNPIRCQCNEFDDLVEARLIR